VERRKIRNYPDVLEQVVVTKKGNKDHPDKYFRACSCGKEKNQEPS
jgi:hypothetical protein